jgi:hypothetical protein
MRTVRPQARRVLAMLSLLVLAGLAGCESAPPPAPPPAPAPVAVEQPPPPVLLPRSVVELASVYEAYVQQAGAIDAAFTAGDRVADSLKTGAHYESDQFQRGQTAYGAIVALQDPTFVAALRAFAKDADRRAQVASQLMSDPSYAASFKGADSAAGLVIAAFSEQGRKLLAVGGKIHQAAYDVQHQSWSRADVNDRPGRLALAKALSAEQQQAIDVDALRLTQNATGAQPMGLSAPAAPPPYTPLVTRSLAVAAMAALGEGGEEFSSQLTALLTETGEGQCLHMAKLNLYQCLAVARPQYEDVFCLGQHAVSDTGQCIMKASVVGYTPPPPVAPAPASDAKPTASAKHHPKKPVKPVDAG